jgi:predicted ribosomally synthesized peptide with nif11-like leader
MSTANIQALFDKAATDPALQHQLEALTAAPLDDLLHLASEQGLPFTKEEWHTYLSDSGSLSDAELSAVTGAAGGGLTVSWERINEKLRNRPSLNPGTAQ